LERNKNSTEIRWPLGRLLASSLVIGVILVAAMFPTGVYPQTTKVPSVDPRMLSGPIWAKMTDLSPLSGTGLLGSASPVSWWSPNQNVTPSTSGMPQNEPSIADNPNDPSNIVIAANDYDGPPLGECSVHVYTSTDGGVSWLNQRLPVTSTGWDPLCDPSVAFDLHGNVYVGHMNEYWEIAVAKSTDKGVTWVTPSVVVQQLPNYIGDDKPYIAVDNWPSSPRAGNVYVSFTRFDWSTTVTTMTIMFSRSVDGGVSWSTPIAISPSVPSNARVVQGSMPAVGPDGTVYVAYYDSTSDGWLLGNYQIIVRSSRDGGVTWSPPVVAATLPEVDYTLPPTNFRAWGTMFPIIAVGPNGFVYIVTGSRGATAGSSDIRFIRSTNRGASWSPPITVNDDGTDRDQFFPWITVQKDNTIHIIWGDRRDDPADVFYNIYYAASVDLGVSFAPNQRVTDQQSDPSWQFNGKFIGDYFGLASTDQFVNAVWTDTRRAGISGQDIFWSFGLAMLVPIPLKAGWNLISLPLVPSNPSTAYILASLIARNELVIVWSYTGTPRSWRYFKPPATGTLLTMTDGDGYWIYVRAADILYVGGSVIAPGSTPPSYPLLLGWNLVGYKPQPKIEAKSVGEYLSSIAGSYDPNNVWLYLNLADSWVRAKADTQLKPGDSIWVLMTAPATLRP
jgi:hypothetical protein